MAFRGGIHPDNNKIPSKVEQAQLPRKVVLPLSQHIGCPCEPIIKPGDYVKTGQKIAESKEFISAPIHASVSGTVKSIEMLPYPLTGRLVKSVIIESDGKDEKIDMPKRDYQNLSPEQLRNIIKEAGVVGLGGAAFPTHVKLCPPKDKQIDSLIINGAECEPYLTTDHSLMLEKADGIIEGIIILKKILKIENAYIGIERNKPDAITILRQKASGQNIKIVELGSKYPQGEEKMLIYSVTKKKVPAGCLPMEIGCVVHNIASCYAVYEAVALSKPLYERVITVSGKVNHPKNMLVRIGTSVSDIISQCGGYKGSPKKLLNGGPMMGIALSSDELPIMKGTSGITIFNDQDIRRKAETSCIRCGKCLEVCPMNLIPALIARYAENDKIEQAERLFARNCFECGACAFSCPSNIPLVHWIRYAKCEIAKKLN